MNVILGILDTTRLFIKEQLAVCHFILTCESQGSFSKECKGCLWNINIQHIILDNKSLRLQ